MVIYILTLHEETPSLSPLLLRRQQRQSLLSRRPWPHRGGGRRQTADMQASVPFSHLSSLHRLAAAGVVCCCLLLLAAAAFHGGCGGAAAGVALQQSFYSLKENVAVSSKGRGGVGAREVRGHPLLLLLLLLVLAYGVCWSVYTARYCCCCCCCYMHCCFCCCCCCCRSLKKNDSNPKALSELIHRSVAAVPSAAAAAGWCGSLV